MKKSLTDSVRISGRKPGLDSIYTASTHPYRLQNWTLEMEPGEAAFCGKPLIVDRNLCSTAIEVALGSD